MRAITVRHPWALALALGIKDVENRDGVAVAAQARALVGQRVAIHASKAIPPDYKLTIRELAARGLWPGNTILTCADCLTTAGRVLAVGTVERVVERGDGDVLNASAWRSSDRYAIAFRNVVRLPEPPLMRGALGFWTLPPAVEAVVREQEARAAA